MTMTTDERTTDFTTTECPTSGHHASTSTHAAGSQASKINPNTPPMDCVVAPSISIEWGGAARAMLRSRFVNKQASGEHPFVHEFEVSALGVSARELIPDNSTVLGMARDERGVIVHVETLHGWLLLMSSADEFDVWASARTEFDLRVLVDNVCSRAPSKVSENHTALKVWFDGDESGMEMRHREFELPTWSDIRRNYPEHVRARLDEVMQVREPQAGGRLLVWYGEPGTGKTNAIRALARAWAPWCHVHYVAEPERFFNSAASIERVITSQFWRRDVADIDTKRGNSPTWKLIVAEDTDDLLRAPGAGLGQGALGRLFNLADGVLGQGSNAMFLITTNAPVDEMHPALLRPGRCLSRLEFGRFGSDDARAWLPEGARNKVTGPATLAELYEMRGDHQRIEHHDPVIINGYL